MAAYPQTDPRTGEPLAADFLVPQGHADYTVQDHRTWRTLFERQTGLLHGRVVPEFHQGLEALGISPAGIPDFRDINRALERATGWTIVAVPGLVPDDIFFAHLAARRFPAGYWIRKLDQLDYIEEPDIFHDVFGHVPLLMLPRYADYIAEYGRAGLACAGRPALANLARLYWYTVEFGLMQTASGLRIFGAGIISSAGEAVYALESPEPLRVRFASERVLRTKYRIDNYQAVYFVLSGYEDLPRLQTQALHGLIGASQKQADIEPGATIAGDVAVRPSPAHRAPGRQGIPTAINR